MQIRSNEDAPKFQKEIDKFQDWCVINRLKLNENKCVIMTVSKNANIICRSYTLNDDILKRVQSYLDLGIIADEKLLFSKHVMLQWDF